MRADAVPGPVRAKPNRPGTAAVLAISFIGALGYSIVLPFLVFLVTRLGGDAVVYGVLVATYPTLQLVAAPVLGRWSDRYGRRRVLLLSHAGTAAGWMLFLVALFLPQAELARLGGRALTLPLGVLFLARALDGLTGGNISVAQAYMADVSDDDDRSANFGRLAISSNLGFIVGPALAGVLGASVHGEVAPVLAAFAISLAGLVLIARMPDSRPCVPPPNLEETGIRKVLGHEPKDCVSPAAAPTRDVVRLAGIPFLLVLYFVLFLGFNLFYTAFPIHAVRGLGWKLAETGAFFSALSLMMVVVQGPVLSRLSRRVPDAALVIVGNLVLGASFLVLYGADGRTAFVAAALFALGNGLMWPSFLSILARVAGPVHQGAVQGLGSSVGALASIVGLLLGGFAYERIGAGTFLLAAGAIELACVMSFWLPRSTPLPHGAPSAGAG